MRGRGSMWSQKGTRVRARGGVADSVSGGRIACVERSGVSRWTSGDRRHIRFGLPGVRSAGSVLQVAAGRRVAPRVDSEPDCDHRHPLHNSVVRAVLGACKLEESLQKPSVQATRRKRESRKKHNGTFTPIRNTETTDSTGNGTPDKVKTQRRSLPRKSNRESQDSGACTGRVIVS